MKLSLPTHITTLELTQGLSIVCVPGLVQLMFVYFIVCLIASNAMCIFCSLSVDWGRDGDEVTRVMIVNGEKIRGIESGVIPHSLIKVIPHLPR